MRTRLVALAVLVALGGCFAGGDDGTLEADAGTRDRPGADAGNGSNPAEAGQGREDDGGDAGVREPLDGAAADVLDAGPDVAGDGAAEIADAGQGTVVDPSCTGILSCVAECPDDDADCVDACYTAGDVQAQDRFLALLTCLDDNACEDVDCIESMCTPELIECLDPSPTAEAPPDAGPPPGNVPAELVGHWIRPGGDEVFEFTFGADGSASHVSYKESTLASCAISVHSEWSTGSVLAEGNQLTVTLEQGATSVAWIGGCGTGYTNPAPGKVLRFSYVLDEADPTALWLTDLACETDYCERLYRRD